MSLENGRTLSDFITVRDYLLDQQMNPDRYWVISFSGTVANSFNREKRWPMYSIGMTIGFVLADEATEKDREARVDLFKKRALPETEFPYLLELLKRVVVTDTIGTNPDEPLLVYIASESVIHRSFVEGRDVYELSISVTAAEAEAFDDVKRKSITPDQLPFNPNWKPSDEPSQTQVF